MQPIVFATIFSGSLSLAVLSGAPALAGPYPDKAIRIVTGGLGGGSDIVARLVAQQLPELLGQPVIVDNRSGNLPAEIVAKAPADGYTLLVESSSFWIGPLLQPLAYDPIKNFAPVSLATTSPLIVVTHSALPAKSIRELIALAKSAPGTLNYASTSTGGGNHLAAELFKAMASVDIVRVSYKSVSAALNGVIAGEVQMMVASAGSVTPLIRSGKLRALAVTSSRASPLFPGVPSVADAGVPDYEATLANGLLAPARTPPAVVARLNREVVQVLNQATLRERFLNLAVEAAPSTPETFSGMIKADVAKWAKLIKNAGIRVE